MGTHPHAGDRIAGEPGSPEWNGLAVDRQITVPAARAVVEAGAELTFAASVDDADEAANVSSEGSSPQLARTWNAGVVPLTVSIGERTFRVGSHGVHPDSV